MNNYHIRETVTCCLLGFNYNLPAMDASNDNSTGIKEEREVEQTG